jgi:hypothetical protein
VVDGGPGSEEAGRAVFIGGAAEAASEGTIEAIDRAAAINQDPAVAEELDQAAASAHVTRGRVGWLRSFLDRLFGPDRPIAAGR